MTKGKAAAWLICFALMLLGPGVVYFFARPYLNTKIRRTDSSLKCHRCPLTA